MATSSALLGGVLVQRNELSIDELKHAIEQQQSSGADMADVLVELGHDREIISQIQSELHEIAQTATALRILVVDDEPALCMLLNNVLGDAGYLVQTAASTEEAREKWTAQAFDIALLDKNLPDGSGVDLLGEFKRSSPSSEIAIVTGYANVASAIEAIRHKVDDYITKPFENAEVLARVQRMAAVLTLKRRNDELRQQLKRQKEDAIAGISRALEALGRDDPDSCRHALSSVLTKLIAPTIHA